MPKENTHVEIVPPKIIQYFNSLLLSTPAKLRDDSQTLWMVYTYIKNKIMKKSKHDPKWVAKCQKLEQEFLELYERAKAKEKDAEGKTKNKTQEPFYRIISFDRGNRDVFKGLRRKSIYI